MLPLVPPHGMQNAHINELMKKHERSFAEIKNYYNDITHNNLDLIKALKEDVAEMKKREAQNEKLMCVGRLGGCREGFGALGALMLACQHDGALPYLLRVLCTRKGAGLLGACSSHALSATSMTTGGRGRSGERCRQ